MKKLAPVFALLLLMISCASESDEIEEFNALAEFNPNAEWTLVKISRPQPDTDKTGEEMEFNETFYLNTDGTFTKTHTEGKTTIESSGKYELIHYWPAINPEPVIAYVSFTHDFESEIIFTCDDNLVEIFYFTPDHRLVSSRGTCHNKVLTFRRIN